MVTKITVKKLAYESRKVTYYHGAYQKLAYYHGVAKVVSAQPKSLFTARQAGRYGRPLDQAPPSRLWRR